MLYAASVKVTFRRKQRRIDVIVNADDLEQATEKAIKQARGIYSPGKKAVYTVTSIISETEALEALQPFPTAEDLPEPDNDNSNEEH